MPISVRGVLKIVSFILTFSLILCAAILGGVVYFNSPPERTSVPAQDGIRFEDSGGLLLEVRNGETAYSVGKRLENAGIIRNRYFWYLISRLGKEHIKTGNYRIDLPASPIQIHTRLVTGDQILVRITIPEGVTLKKAARILEDERICGSEEFLEAASLREILDAYNVPGTTMEGYLYPDTYLFPLAYPASKVVSAMADNFFRRLNEIAPEALFITANELSQRIIIASIVEREYRIPGEATLMAGVFYNRLDIGMALQSCATVEYVITEIQGLPHPEILYNRDLEIVDPYNTYTQSGLPPGPISAPGETAIRAAFYPAESDYLYFRLIDPTAGQHYFSRTLDDHIRAGSLYVKG